MGKTQLNIGLMDLEKKPEPKIGTTPLTGNRYTSKEFMEKEWESIWTKTWLVAGLSSQIPNTGDRTTCEIGPESILCTRDKDGKARAFYNVCQHRGNILVHEEEGSGKHLVCNYHGWRFTPDGELAVVPCPEDFPQGNPCGKVRLVELRCEEWAGFVWYSMNDDVAPLDEFLGPVKSQIETYRMEEMKRTKWVTIDGDFNWKVVQDNFSESYHLPFVHPQGRYFMEQNYSYCQFDIYEEGHTRMIMPGARPTMSLRGEFNKTVDLMVDDLKFWGLDPDDFRDDPHSMREAIQKVKREKGAEKGFDFSRYQDAQLTDHFHYTVFPNLSFSLKPDGCIFLFATPHPTDPEKCIFDMWYFTWYPEGVDEYHSHSIQQVQSPDYVAKHEVGVFGEVSAGLAIDQDISIWNSQQRGLRSRGYTRDYMPDQERRVRFFHENIDRYIKKAGY